MIHPTEETDDDWDDGAALVIVQVASETFADEEDEPL